MTSPQNGPAVSEDRGLVEGALKREPGSMRVLTDRLECIPRFLFKIHGQRGRRVPSEWLTDLAQTTFLVVLEKLSEFRGDACLETWVYRTCYFQYLAHEKVARRKRPMPVATETLDERPAAESVPGEALDRAKRLDQLGEAIAGLDDEQRNLLEQRHFENRSFKDIAIARGLPVGTLKNRYYRVLHELRKRLAENGKRAPRS